MKLYTLTKNPELQDILNIAVDEGYCVETFINWSINIDIIRIWNPVSVNGYYFSDEFEQTTRNIFERIKNNYDNISDTAKYTFLHDKYESFKIFTLNE